MLQYSALNNAVLSYIPLTAINILDVGCGIGEMGKFLKEQNSKRKVFGITYSKEEHIIAEKYLHKAWVLDINNELPDTDIQYDCIIFSHVLEHTFEPEKVLKTYAEFLINDGLIIIALPNVLQYKQRLEFAKGNFKYSISGGVMDITHFRFFDWVTAQKMITNTGLRIVFKKAAGSFPLFFFRKILPSFTNLIDGFALKHWPGFFGVQFIFIAKK